jgi:hypothetical protein
MTRIMEDSQVRRVGAAAQLVASVTFRPLGRAQSVMLLSVDKVDRPRHPWHNLTDAWLRQSDTFSWSESQSSQAIQVGKKRGLLPLGHLRFR